MMKLKAIVLFLFFVVFLNGCVSMRSAEGLSKGEVNINYVMPLAGSIRYGATDNIELRLGYQSDAGDLLRNKSIMSDVYVHTKADSNAFNIGVTLGGLYFMTEAPMWYYSGITLSQRVNKYVCPYVSLNGGFESTKKFTSGPSYTNLAIGADLYIPIKDNRFKILLTPEIGAIGEFSVAMNAGIVFSL